MENLQKIHIGIIPDGNRRWCKKNNLDVFNLIEMLKNIIYENYKKITEDDNIQTEYSYLLLIKEISVYVLSKDNMSRDDNTMEMIQYGLEIIFNNIYENNKNIFKIQFIGEIELLPNKIQELCRNIEENTENGKILLTAGIAYDPIKDSYRLLNNEKRNKYEQTNIDLIIRTGAEQRSSGFFPLQSLYSEWKFLQNLFPDTTLIDIKQSILEYLKRERRYGK